MTGEKQQPGDPSAWQGGPMRPDQAARLQALAAQTGDDQAFDAALTADEAARRIAALKAKLGREDDSGVDRLPLT